MEKADESIKDLKMTSTKTLESSNGKRSRKEIDDASLARFKGVVPQQNGHWGAQIYANHQRVWLGTFKSESEAAMAYDSASIGLRTRDSHRNFPWSDHNIQEPNFQNHHTIQDVLNMIKAGSYQSKFADFVNNIPDEKSSINLNKDSIHDDIQFACMHVVSRTSVNTPCMAQTSSKEVTCIRLFQKELTPSDVGKLNRLVIPKKYAVKHFPYIAKDQQSLIDGGIEDIELVFYDKLMKTWKFRYWYCKSSQSFVFTRGWNRFVKDKKLREKDVVAFYTCECPGETENELNFFLIDVNYNGGDENGRVDKEKVVKRVKKSSFYRHENDKEHGLSELQTSHNMEEKRITLFGAQIN